jgi:hypothetical protein
MEGLGVAVVTNQVIACPTLAAACVAGQLKPCERRQPSVPDRAAAPLTDQHLFLLAPQREHSICILAARVEAPQPSEFGSLTSGWHERSCVAR